MLEALSKAVSEVGEAASSGDGSKFMDSPKEDKGSGRDFMESLKRDSGTGKSFMESLKNDSRETQSHKELTPISEKERERIKDENGWSDEIIDQIGSVEEYEIYRDAGLEEKDVNGKPCLAKSEIDFDQKDEFGRTNKERMEQGLPPLDKDGKPIELHHIGQKSDASLAELGQGEHRGKGNDGVLHDKTKETEIDRIAFGKEKADHWETRAKDA